MSWNGNARLNAKRDANERLIIEALEARGFVVSQLNGKGVPDLLVGRVGANGEPQMWLVEVKMPKKKLNTAQVAWREKWTGPPPILLRTVDEALKFPCAGITR